MSNFKYLPPQPLLPPAPKGAWGTLTGALIATSFKLPSNADYTNPVAGMFTYSPPAKYRGGGDWEPQKDLITDVASMSYLSMTYTDIFSIGDSPNLLPIPPNIESGILIDNATFSNSAMNYVDSFSVSDNPSFLPIQPNIESGILSDSPNYTILSLTYIESFGESDNFVQQAVFNNSDSIVVDDSNFSLPSFVYNDSIIETDKVTNITAQGGSYSYTEPFFISDYPVYNPKLYVVNDTLVESENNSVPKFSTKENPLVTDSTTWIKP